MPFQKFVCWDIDRVRDVMNTNAELAARDTFLAVHSEFPLSICNPGVRDPKTSPHWTAKPDDFLQQFLSRDQRHVQIAVFGDSGSGKSHFIRWMTLNIPAEDGRRLISIPRAGVSLRGVVELILDILPSGEARQYRDRLNQAGLQRATRDQLKERLRSNIARAIAEDEPRMRDQDADLETELIERLPDLFEDPELRSHFGRSGGVIEQLVDHVLSASTAYAQADQRREFSISDLPLTGVQTRHMSMKAQKVFDFLRADKDAQRVAVDIINRNLNKAIGQVLNFTGDLLVELISEVRRYLRGHSQELILLVEDLTRSQGLDLALLDALIIEGSEANGLCTLRWAVAVNEGYYTRLPDTVKTRMTQVVDMDWAGGGGRLLMDDSKLVAFASRYLNAARLPAAVLHDWASTPNEERGDIPVACLDCPHRETCHATFGSQDGIGLYPFNPRAINNMLQRLDNRFGERFNPRLLVKEVMAEVLGTHGREIERGQFPPGNFLPRFGVPQLPPMVREALDRRDAQNAARQQAILELWGSGSTVVDLPEELFVAFALPKPRIEAVREPPKPVARPSAPTLDPDIAAIRAWGNGSSLQDRPAAVVRPLIHAAIVGHIDWDGIGLVRSSFAAGNGAFRSEGIFLRRQITQPRLSPIKLEIPIRDDRTSLLQAAMALEGLLRFKQDATWNFPGAPELFVSFANCLDEWSAQVVEQMKRLPDHRGKWEPVGTAVEVLAIGAAMGGRPARASATLADYLDALFEEWPSENPAQSPEWRALYQAIVKDRAKLTTLVRAWSSGTKGGQRGPFIDPSKLAPALRQLRRHWQPSQSPPEGTDKRRDDYGKLAQLHAKIATELPRAAAAEWQRRTGWLDGWRREVPEGISRKHVIAAFRELIETAQKHGVGFSPDVGEALKSALQSLENVQLDDAVKAGTELRSETEPMRRLPDLARERDLNAIVAIERFVPAARAFLDEVETWVSNRTELLDEGARTVQDLQFELRKTLRQLSRNLSAIGGIDEDAH